MWNCDGSVYFYCLWFWFCFVFVSILKTCLRWSVLMVVCVQTWRRSMFFIREITLSFLLVYNQFNFLRSMKCFHCYFTLIVYFVHFISYSSKPFFLTYGYYPFFYQFCTLLHAFLIVCLTSPAYVSSLPPSLRRQASILFSMKQRFMAKSDCPIACLAAFFCA